MKRAFLYLARALGLFALCSWWTRKHLRILCYHGIWLGPPPHYGDRLFMSPCRFADHMALLERWGMRVIPLDEALLRHAQGRTRAHDVVITIDDAWLGTYLHMVPELERRGFPATLYVTTYYVLARRPVINVLLGYLCSRPDSAKVLSQLATGAMTHAQRVAALVYRVEALPTLEERWSEVRRLAGLLSPGSDIDAIAPAFRLMEEHQLRDAAGRGIDIQLHTHTHRMHNQDPARVRNEIQLNREKLGAILGKPATDFVHFCYPSGEHDPRVFATLQAAGIESATTTLFDLAAPGSNLLAMPRVLDGESVSDIELAAMLSGFWSCALRLRRLLRPRPAAARTS